MLRTMSIRTRTLVAVLLAFVATAAFLASPLMNGTAKAEGCQQSFSKYAGTYCIPETSDRVKKDAASIFFGCLFGGVGGNPVSIGYGCLAGAVNVAIDHAWGK